jgi:copper transport protein
MLRRAITLVFSVPAAVLVLTVLGAAPALAHNTFDDSSPADGAVLDSTPLEWSVSFAKSVPIESASGSVVNGDGTRTALGPPRHGGNDSTVVFALPAGLAGDVTARWRLVSSDGHVITGRVGFTVGTGSPSDTAPRASGDVTTDMTDPPAADLSAPTEEGTGVPGPVRGLLRLAGYLAVLLLGGMFFVDRAVAPGIVLAGRGAGAARWALAIAAVVPLAQFAVFVNDVGAGGASLAGAVGDALSLTPGAMLLLRRVIGAAFLVALLPMLRPDTSAPRAGLTVGALAAMYLVALAYVGHSRSRSLPLVGVPVDVVHTVAAAVWLGGLFVMVVVVVPSIGPPAALAAYRRFGPYAQRAVVVITVTGIVQGLRLHTGVTSLVTTAHGLLLLVKLAAVAGMLRLAARNRSMLVQTPDHGPRAGLLVARTSALESVFGLLVIVLTAALVAVTPD